MAAWLYVLVVSLIVQTAGCDELIMNDADGWERVKCCQDITGDRLSQHLLKMNEYLDSPDSLESITG